MVTEVLLVGFILYDNIITEGVEQCREQECLKGVISKGKAYVLPGKKKWTHERTNKTGNATINKAYAEYKQN